MAVKKITVCLSSDDYKKLDMLVKKGVYPSLETAVRVAIKRLISKELGNGELS